MIPPQAEKVKEMDFRGIWRDDKDRLVKIVKQREDGIWLGFLINPKLGEEVPQAYTKYLGVNTKDGTRLMERKRGEEKGWD